MPFTAEDCEKAILELKATAKNVRYRNEKDYLSDEGRD
jgi:hypothetical protein